MCDNHLLTLTYNLDFDVAVWHDCGGYGQKSYDRREEEDLSVKGNLIEEDKLLLHILELSC